MRIITLVSLLGLLWLPGLAYPQANSAANEEAVEAASDSLANFPWYDAETEGLKRLEAMPPRDVKNRDSKWIFTPPTWSMPDWLYLLLKIAVWTLLVVLIAGIAYLLAKTFMNLDESFAGASRPDEDLSLSGDVDRVDALPFQLKRPRGDLLAEAQRLYDEGRYAEAMIYLYSYQLVQLDKSQVIRLARGKTNRQYLREVRRRSNLFELMQRSMVTFEDVFFGNYPLDRSGFESCWTQLDEFHHQLDPEHALA